MPTTAADPQIRAFHRALTDLVKAYQFRDRDRITCHGVTVTQCYALEAIALRGPLTMNALADELQLDKSTASRTADALEELKLVRRVAHPESRRSIYLEVTRAGKALHSRIEGELLESESAMLAEFSPAVRKAATDIIGRLAAMTVARMAAGNLREQA